MGGQKPQSSMEEPTVILIAGKMQAGKTRIFNDLTGDNKPLNHDFSNASTKWDEVEMKDFRFGYTTKHENE